MNIFDLYTTKQEALDFLDRLSLYSDALFRVKDKSKAFDKYFTKKEQEVLCHPSFVIPESEASQGSINNDRLLDSRLRGNDKIDGSQVKKLLVKLQEVVQNIPKVYITLALNPTVLMMNNIHQKLSQYLPKPFFLEISLDKDIIAGAILSYEGVQRDYSLRRSLDGR